jgi:hypothetical protein
MNMHVGSELALELHRQAVERRKRMAMGAKLAKPVPAPAVRHIPNMGFLRGLVRPPHVQDAVLYLEPIGPIRVRDILMIASPPESSQISARRIMREICEQYGVTKIDLISDRRTANLVRPRQHACYRLRTETTLSYPQIGKLMGGRDHTTAIASYRKFLSQLEAGKVTVALPSSLAAE